MVEPISNIACHKEIAASDYINKNMRAIGYEYDLENIPKSVLYSLRNLIAADFLAVIELKSDCAELPSMTYLDESHNIQKKLLNIKSAKLVSTKKYIGLKKYVKEVVARFLENYEVSVIITRVVISGITFILVAGKTLPGKFEKSEALILRLLSQKLLSDIKLHMVNNKLDVMCGCIGSLARMFNDTHIGIGINDILVNILRKIKNVINAKDIGVVMRNPETNKLALEISISNFLDNAFISNNYSNLLCALEKGDKCILSGVKFSLNENDVKSGRYKAEICAALPIKIEKESIGLICAVSKAGEFVDGEIQLLNLLAIQISLLLNGNKMQLEVKKREHEARALREVLELSTLRDPNELFKLIVHKIRHLLPCDVASLGLLDEDSSYVRIKARAGDKLGVLKDLVIRPGIGITGQVMGQRSEKQQIFLQNALKPEVLIADDIDIVMNVENLCSVLAMPIICGERIVGVIYACRKDANGFSDSDIQIMSSFIKQIAIAIENSLLYQNEKETVKKLHDLNMENHEQRKMLESSLEIHRNFASLVLQDKGFNAVTNKLSEMVENPVIICNKSFNILSMSIPAEIDWTVDENEICKNIKKSEDLINKLLYDANHYKRFKCKLTFNNEAIDLPSIIVPIIISGHIKGYVFVVEKSRSVNEMDNVAIEHALNIITLELIKQITIYEAESRIKGGIVSDLLSGEIKSVNEFLEKGNLLGYDFSSPYQVMCISIEKMENNNLEMNMIKARAVDRIYSIILSSSPKSMLMEKDGYIVLLVDCSEVKAKQLKTSAKKLANQIMVSLLDHINGISALIGIGRMCFKLDDYKKSFYEAADTLLVLSKLRKKNIVISSDEMGIYALLSSVDKGI